METIPSAMALLRPIETPQGSNCEAKPFCVEDVGAVASAWRCRLKRTWLDREAAAKPSPDSKTARRRQRGAVMVSSTANATDGSALPTSSRLQASSSD